MLVHYILFLENLQEVTRDFSFILDKKISSGEITRSITSADKNNIKEVRVFDLYEGEKLKKDEKSFGVTVIFQPKENSFSEKNLDEFSKNIISIIREHLPIVDFKDVSENTFQFCILRHDIEFSIDRAYELAKVEKELGVTSTYTVQVRNNTYNALSEKNIDLINLL